MDEDKKKIPEEEEKKKPDSPPDDEEKKGETSEETPDNKQDNGNAAEPDTDKQGEKPEKETDNKPEKLVPELSETDKLRAENLTLKTQLEAMKAGFSPDCMEDAVTLAEAIVKRDGTDITAALQAVAKKYPDWKTDSKGNSKGGFKIGADSTPDDKKPDSDRLSQAFGIKKK
jgi:hypothetical protein